MYYGLVLIVLFFVFLSVPSARGREQKSSVEGCRVESVCKAEVGYKVNLGDIGDATLAKRLSSLIKSLSEKGVHLVSIVLSERDAQQVTYTAEFSTKMTDVDVLTASNLAEELARVEFGYKRGESGEGMIIRHDYLTPNKLVISVSTKGVRILNR